MQDTKRLRCAIYARFSTNLQRSASIDDQIRQCREYADRNGYLVVDGYVRSDEAISGATLQGRKGLESLVDAAKKTPRPFDAILLDDTSRLARSTADASKTVEILKFNSVAVISISQGIDSRESGARQLLTLNAMMDEEFNVGVADKVHRGQEGRVLQGLVSGGRCYGYRNVPIEDPTRIAKYGRPAVTGVRAEIVEEQANVVRRIFKMCSDGMSLSKMAKMLNADGVLSPEPSRNRKIRSWCPSSIRELLLNERYKGINVWKLTFGTGRRRTEIRKPAARSAARGQNLSRNMSKCQIGVLCPTSYGIQRMRALGNVSYGLAVRASRV
jgi:site-specific DNA recombinase